MAMLPDAWGTRLSNWTISDVTADKNIITVAVLEIHIETKNVTNITPANIRLGLPPNIDKIRSDKRSCSCHRSMAKANKKPPMNRNMT